MSGRAPIDLECRPSVSDHDEGRLSHLTGRGPRAVVSHASPTTRSSFCAEYNEICQHAPGRQITMRINALTTTTFTELVVTGIGHLAENRAGIAGPVDLPEHWPAGVSTHLVCLDLADLEGSIRLRRTSADPPNPCHPAGLTSLTFWDRARN